MSLFCSHVSSISIIIIFLKKGETMNTIKNVKSGVASFIVSGKARLVILVITLALFVLAAGAPGASGGVGD